MAKPSRANHCPSDRHIWSIGRPISAQSATTLRSRPWRQSSSRLQRNRIWSSKESTNRNRHLSRHNRQQLNGWLLGARHRWTMENSWLFCKRLPLRSTSPGQRLVKTTCVLPSSSLNLINTCFLVRNTRKCISGSSRRSPYSLRWIGVLTVRKIHNPMPLLARHGITIKSAKTILEPCLAIFQHQRGSLQKILI